MSDKIEEIRERARAATPGPWRWFGNPDRPYIATTHSGRLYVLGVHVEITEGYQQTEEPYEFLTPGEYDKRGHAPGDLGWSFDRQHTVHLQFRTSGDPDSPARMHSHRDIARYEVLGGKSKASAGLPPDADRSNSPLYRDDIVGFDSPDAEFIVRARTDVEILLAEIDRLEEQLAEATT